jgi:cob(I)alamin adenosyltransferase
MSKTKVVTRLGDGGETGLGNGQRVPKDAETIESVGVIDELSAALGMLRTALVSEDPEAEAMLRRVQIDLFHIAAELHHAVAGVTDEPLLRLEAELDAMNDALPRLANFILPGGARVAAEAHAARALARRAERRVVSLSRKEPVNPDILRYMNRLSDFLFVFARRLNARSGGDDVYAPRGVR